MIFGDIEEHQVFKSRPAIPQLPAHSRVIELAELYEKEQDLCTSPGQFEISKADPLNALGDQSLKDALLLEQTGVLSVKG